jgi:Domain of unknown function (DUF4304)
MSPIDSKTVDKALRADFWPALAGIGFNRRTGRTAWRDRPHAVQTVNIQSFNRYLADGLACTPFSFAVNLGVYYPVVDDATVFMAKDPSRPAEHHCQARFHMAKGIAQPDPEPERPPIPPPDPRLQPRTWRDRPDVWYVRTDGANIDEVVSDARDRVLTIGVPWLERLADVTVARHHFAEVASTNHVPGIVAEGYQGALGSPARVRAVDALDELLARLRA